MQIAVGHANPDFDAYAATIAATKLHPGTRGVFLGSQNANVKAFHNLHQEFLAFVDLKTLDPEAVTRVIMVDTRYNQWAPDIYVEGKKVVSHRRIAKNQPYRPAFAVTLSDGAMSFVFDNPGHLPYFALNGIIIEPVQ